MTINPVSISRRIMKDSQHVFNHGVVVIKYIKANNERFSTLIGRSGRLM